MECSGPLSPATRLSKINKDVPSSRQPPTTLVPSPPTPVGTGFLLPFHCPSIHLTTLMVCLSELRGQLPKDKQAALTHPVVSTHPEQTHSKWSDVEGRGRRCPHFPTRRRWGLLALQRAGLPPLTPLPHPCTEDQGGSFRSYVSSIITTAPHPLPFLFQIRVQVQGLLITSKWREAGPGSSLIYRGAQPMTNLEKNERVRGKGTSWRQMKKRESKVSSPLEPLLSQGCGEAGEESAQPLADKIEQLWRAAACGT